LPQAAQFGLAGGISFDKWKTYNKIWGDSYPFANAIITGKAIKANSTEIQFALRDNVRGGCLRLTSADVRCRAAP
jgi:hypothetical protein